MRKRLSESGVGQLELQIGPQQGPNDPVVLPEGNREVASSGGAPVKKESLDQPPAKGVKSSRKQKAYSLYDKVFREENLWRAWERVRENKGAPGCDRVTIAQFAARAETEITTLSRQLREKTYQPRPVRRRDIDKAGGGKRPLGIPSGRDRVVQQAVLQVIEPYFEPKFSERSHGFRPERGCATAVTMADRAAQHYEWIVDLDLEAFFDTVHHERLLDAVHEEIADGSVLRLIRMMLKAGVLMPTGDLEPTEIGTPQGGPLSPLLANLYLHDFDLAMQEQGHRHIRYADDVVFFAQSEAEAGQALEAARQMLEGPRLRLRVHPSKTKVVSIDQGFDFLGFCYFRDRKGQLQKIVRKKSRERFRDAIRERTPRNVGQKLPKAKRMTLNRLRQNQRVAQIIKRLNAYLRGWHWYFKQVRTNWNVFLEFDKFVRRRVRSAITGRFALGRWHQVLGNQLLAALGLLSLEELQRPYHRGVLKGFTSSESSA